MAESEVARFLREIDEAYQAAEWALTGLACGTARHDFINAKEERIAICHQELTTLIGPDEATALVAGVYFQGEKSGEISSPYEEVREGHDEQRGTRAATTRPL
jgi:hypothetical protein